MFKEIKNSPWVHSPAQMSKEDIENWWNEREKALTELKKNLFHTVEVRRDDEIEEFLDDEEILHFSSEGKNADYVKITYFADEETEKMIKDYILYAQSDERYYYHSGCAWDV